MNNVLYKKSFKSRLNKLFNVKTTKEIEKEPNERF